MKASRILSDNLASHTQENTTPSLIYEKINISYSWFYRDMLLFQRAEI